MKKGTVRFFGLALILLAAIAVASYASAQTIERQRDGVIVGLKEGAIKLQVCSERIVRVLYDPKGIFAPTQSLVIEKEWQRVKFNIQKTNDQIKIRTTRLRARVDRRAGTVSFCAAAGKLFFEEDPDNPRSVTPARVLDEDTHHAQLNIRLSADEGVYGLGQYQGSEPSQGFLH